MTDQTTWDVKVDKAFTTFCTETRVTRSQISKALGLAADGSDLSLSHLNKKDRTQSIQQRLVQRLRRHNLPEIAVCLNLDSKGYRSLVQLAAAIVHAVTGFEVATGHGSVTEALEMGIGGIDLYRQDKWETGTSLLLSSWAVLVETFPHPDDPAYSVALRIGTELMSLQVFSACASEALGVANFLIKKSRQYPTKTLEDVRTKGNLLNSAAIVMRHNGYAPATILSYLKQAHQLSMDERLALDGRIATLRDQAKPLLCEATNAPGSAPNADKVAQALRTLEESEAWARILRKDKGEITPWLNTRLTLIECLSAIGQQENARRTFDETLGDNEVCQVLSMQSNSLLRMKVAMAELASRVGQDPLEDIAEAYGAFVKNPDNTRYVERRTLATQILDGASLGDLERVRLLLIR